MQKIVVISGGSSGLGKAMAASISSDHRVIILSPNKAKVSPVARAIGCDFEVCDIGSYKSVRTAIKNIIGKYKKIDCLINNAGIWIEGELMENSADRVQEVMRINATGTILLTKEVIPQMKKQKQGLIIMINSQGGLYGKAERSVYTASKWALTGFTKSLQMELSKYGIRVTGLYPGKMKTNLFKRIGIKKDMADALEPEEVARLVKFILSLPSHVVLPEVGVKHIKN